MAPLLRVLNLRPGEGVIVLLMGGLYYLVLCTHYLLKPARDSLFLSESGPERLPLVFILGAVLSAPIVSAYTRLGRGLALNRLILASLVFLAANLVGLRYLIAVPQPWVQYVFYIWVGLFGAVTTSQFWLLANSVFDPSQAKRLFALLGAGGILGAVTGGEVTSFLVGRAGLATEDLLWVAIGTLGGCAAMVAWLWSATSRDRSEEKRPPRPARAASRGRGAILASVRQSRHLSLIVGILAATVTAGTLVDYLFKTVAYASFDQTSELTAFLGAFYSRVSLVSLMLQVLVAGRLLGRLGAVGGLMALPLTLGVGTAGMLLAPGLLAAIFLRGGEMTLKYSVDRTARELLFLPIAASLKREIKVWFDLFVDRIFRGLTGLLLLLALALGASVRSVAAMTAAVLIVWVVLVVRMRSAYAEAFRQAIVRREAAVVGSLPTAANPAVLESLVHSLESSNPQQVLYALRQLQGVEDIEVTGPLTRLLHDPNALVRQEALRLLGRWPGDQRLAALPRHLAKDPDPGVRMEAMWLQLRQQEEGLASAVSLQLAEPDPDVQAAALEAVALYGDDEDVEALDMKRIENLLDAPVHRGRTNALLRVMGRKRSPAYVPWLLSRLAIRADRAAAREALTAYGPEVLGPLVDHMRSPDTRSAVRRNIPRIVSRIEDQRSVEALLEELREGDRDLHPHLVNSLYHLHRAFPRLSIPRSSVLEILEDEARTWFTAAQAHGTLEASLGGSDGSRDRALLMRSLQEKREQAFRHMFRLLGLLYPVADMRRARENALSADRVERANAREYLDQTLKLPERAYILPTVGEGPDVFSAGDSLFGLQLDTVEHAMRYLITGPDVWLASCALLATRSMDKEPLRALVEAAETEPDPVLRETARLVLGRRSA